VLIIERVLELKPDKLLKYQISPRKLPRYNGPFDKRMHISQASPFHLYLFIIY
jgi:hypothetical protein